MCALHWSRLYHDLLWTEVNLSESLIRRASLQYLSSNPATHTLEECDDCIYTFCVLSLQHDLHAVWDMLSILSRISTIVMSNVTPVGTRSCADQQLLMSELGKLNFIAYFTFPKQ